MEVFVFGSNEAGRHGKGAALYAKTYYGAINGQGRGRQGQSYAIPTKTATLQVRSLEDIEVDVRAFLVYAADHLDERFEVTRIGCGLAGYSDWQIAPMFAGATDNCVLPTGWWQYQNLAKKIEEVERGKLQAIKDFIAKQREQVFLDFLGVIKDGVLRQVQEEIERIENEIPS